MSPEMISQDARRLAEEIICHVRAQLSLWRRVPWLALEADGRASHDDARCHAFMQGVWPAGEHARVDAAALLIDLRTGEIIRAAPFLTCGWYQRPDDAEVLGLVGSLASLDAAALIARLEAECARPYADHYEPREKEEWRMRLRVELNLKKQYDEACRRRKIDLRGD